MNNPNHKYNTTIQISMNHKINKFKQELNCVFDDNLHTKQWHNIVDWTIIGFIVLSTVEIFLTTFNGFSERHQTLLNVIDWMTQIFFTIEVTLRIWNADVLNTKYKGFKGRIRYCFSFYGFIDFISTYPFFLNLIVPIPYTIFKAFRVARLLRIFRYLPSFHLLSSALKSKKDELVVSLQFLVIVTLILSFILFFVEHAAQPGVYDNGWTPILWSFMQYIGDPGGFAEYPPITTVGRIIACIVGILGIAIFAVPAGLIGSGFTEVMEEEKKATELKENAHKINEMMLVKSIRRGNLFWPAKNISFGDLKLNLNLTEDEILKAAGLSSNLRVKNLAAAVSEGPKTDMMVVNQFYVNEEYGCHLERGSSVTIVNPLGVGDNGLSYFDWHIAQLGGFNYVANEKFSRQHSDRSFRCNFYTVDDETQANDSFLNFASDILAGRGKGDWIIVIAGEQTVKNKTHLHFEFGGDTGEERFDFEGGIAPDRDTVKKLFDDMQHTLDEKVGLTVDAHKVQLKLNPQNISRYLQARTEANVLLLTVSYKLMVFDKEVYNAVLNIADVLNRNLEHTKPVGLHKDEYLVRPIDSPYWKDLYGVN